MNGVVQVTAGTGDDFGELTDAFLYEMDAMIAAAYENYGKCARC